MKVKSKMLNSIAGENLPLLVFLGDYEPSKFKAIKNIPYMNKPEGGLWVSTYSEKIGSEWLDFCVRDYTTYPYLEESRKGGFPMTMTLMRARKGKNFILIDSYEDLEAILEKYNIGESLSSCLRMKETEWYGFLTKQIDFEKASISFDGIRMTTRGQFKTRLSLPYNLYGWDVESVLFFNQNAFDIMKKIECKKKWLHS